MSNSQTEIRDASGESAAVNPRALEEHIARLKVAMCDAGGVEMIQAL